MSTSPSATPQSAQDRSIYILLTRSGTWFSRLIHLVTSDCYTHASIGLDGPSGPFLQLRPQVRALRPPRRPGGGAAGRQEPADPLLSL